VLGIDPARGGADSTVIVARQGRDIVAIKRYHGEDTMTIVGRVIDAIEEFKPALTVIDEGGLGYGILDRLNEQRYKVRGVNFGWKAKNPVMWGNKRAELWGAMKEWLRTASIPPDKQLKADLIGPMTKPNSAGTIFLEGKKEMRSRGLASPDAADALAVTFAFPVAHREYNSRNEPRKAYGQSSVATSWMGA
jgi:phage terminase large subunit